MCMHAWTMTTSLYWLVGEVDAIEWACVLCDHHIQNDWVSRAMKICIKFCIKLEYSSKDTIHMIQKATAMGNWWLAASSRQCAHSCTTSRAEIFGKTSNHPGDSHPTAQIWFPVTSDFSQNWNHLWKERFQAIDEIQENMTGQLMAIGRTVWGPKVPTLKRPEASLSYAQCFLYLVSLKSVSIFHIIWLDTF